jgi:hypothetical protein
MRCLMVQFEVQFIVPQIVPQIVQNPPWKSQYFVDVFARFEVWFEV